MFCQTRDREERRISINQRHACPAYTSYIRECEEVMTMHARLTLRVWATFLLGGGVRMSGGEVGS